MTIYNIYTDGSCAPNPGRGGWAYIILYLGQYQEQSKINSGAVFNTTNNRMELRAVLQALRDMKYEFKSWDKIKIYTDSILITKWNSEGRGKKNRDMVDELVEFNRHFKSLNVQIEYIWVKGHSGIRWNEFVDDLAGSARLNAVPEHDQIPKEIKHKQRKHKYKHRMY